MRTSAAKIIVVVLLIATFVALMPVSFRLAERLFTFPFHPEWHHAVLLVCPDHVEMQWFHDTSEVAIPTGRSGCTFNISPERQSWTERQVHNTPSPNGNAGWVLRVKQLGADRQRVQLELLGDGVTGLVYDVNSNAVTPVYSRLVGPEGAFEILLINGAIWASCWGVVWIIRKRFSRLAS